MFSEPLISSSNAEVCSCIIFLATDKISGRVNWSGKFHKVGEV